jgi:hypothetical protein
VDPKWRTFAVLLILLGGATAAIALLGDDASTPPITIDQAPTPEGGVEVLVTVSDDVNVPETADGQRLVDLVCTDEAGEVVVRSQQVWPLEKDGDPPAAHAHQPVSDQELRAISACRLDGTDPELSGELGLAR